MTPMVRPTVCPEPKCPMCESDNPRVRRVLTWSIGFPCHDAWHDATNPSPGSEGSSETVTSSAAIVLTSEQIDAHNLLMIEAFVDAMIAGRSWAEVVACPAGCEDGIDPDGRGGDTLAMKACNRCGGKGWLPGTLLDYDCPDCEGRGSYATFDMTENIDVARRHWPCKSCGGSGVIDTPEGESAP